MKFYLLFLFLITTFTATAQSLYKGMVVDSATFSPLAYVSVQIKNSLKGTTTDVNGNFSINAKAQDTLIFTLVGYEHLELPLMDYETSMIRMTEKRTMLAPITIQGKRISSDRYDGMFDEQNENLKKKLPFYYSRARKDKVKAGRWRDENLRVKTYMDVVVHNPETKKDLMKRYSLNETQYYTTLTKFNERYYQIMYYLTAAELLSLLDEFYEADVR